MHVITFVTLVFLPPTFVAVRLAWPFIRQLLSDLTFDQTFFQSGLVSWPNWDAGNDGTQIGLQFNRRGFKLFCIICIPMMFITGMVWFFIYKCLKKRRMRKRTEEPEAV